MTANRTAWAAAGATALLLCLLAMLRPVDHDESQYVAAAVLSAHGLLPYRDYAYLQTPLQPFVLAPVAWAAGGYAWIALRLVNALLGAVAIAAVAGAARAAGARAMPALIAAGLFATCDILLFSVGTARNDALPAAALAVALWLALRPPTRASAVAIGALLAGAAAAKISYALPAAAYGLIALFDRARRPGWVALGAAPLLALVAWTATLNPAGFWFGTLVFPAAAPVDWYAGRPWKLSVAGKAVDLLKFLALGPALLALVAVARGRGRRWPDMTEWLLIAGLLAAVLPTPTWRQYLLPALPPLFVLLARRWSVAPPTRGWRIAVAVFACAGLAPSLVALGSGNAMPVALAQTRAIRVALDRAGVDAPVATLSPQFLSGTGRLPDPRFATGPFVFRGTAIAPPGKEKQLVVVPRREIEPLFAAAPPAAILTGGEGWTSGDARLDAVLADWARRHRYTASAAGRFTLWVPAITPR